MRAVLHERYGPPEILHVGEVERPAPKDDEILVRVHASTVTRTDCGFRAAWPFFARVFTGMLRPKRKISGIEFAGIVEAVGPAVGSFAVGARVFGIKGGANAEFVCVRESGVVARMPERTTFEEAAAMCDGACTALSCLKQAHLEAGQRIVVYGASGSIGTAAVQIAKNLGAHVTAVCNTRNVELVRSLGPDEVIDYEREDFTRRGERYDLVFDAVGRLSYRLCRRALKPDGLYMTTDLGFMWHAPLLALVSKRVTIGIARYTQEDVLVLQRLIESGAYRAVIDRTYPLDDVVEATRYVETGQKTGNVVLTVP
jgi:NADPH:quinone reductase-like Zn-dependent oxidoreductase